MTRWVAVSLVAAAVMVGCGKDKTTGPAKPVPFTYPALDTPQHTLMNLKLAWDRRDSIRTREVYDDDYVGTALNPDPQEPPFVFTKDTEVAVVWALGRDADVILTEMDLKPETTWMRFHSAADPEGWATIQLLPGVRLQVSNTTTDFVASTSNIEFKFKPTLDSASPTDTTWKIVRWTETF